MDNADIEAEMEPYMDLLLDIAEVMINMKEHIENEKHDEEKTETGKPI